MFRLSALPVLRDNLVWLLEGPQGRLVVDPGDAGPVLAALGDPARPTAILVTHHHADHVDGVPGIVERTGKVVSLTAQGGAGPGLMPSITQLIVDADNRAISSPSCRSRKVGSPWTLRRMHTRRALGASSMTTLMSSRPSASFSTCSSTGSRMTSSSH